jgi:hypothetical protein
MAFLGRLNTAKKILFAYFRVFTVKKSVRKKSTKSRQRVDFELDIIKLDKVKKLDM